MPTTRHHAPAVLYFGNDWFAENRTSSHHIALRLAQHFDVYYIECPGLRPPSGSGRDLKKIARAVRRFCAGPRTVAPGIHVMTLLQIPLHRLALVRRFNFLLTWLTVRWLIWRRGLVSRISWFVAPHLAPLVGRLGETTSVYYCVDDYAAFPGVDTAAVRQMDEHLTRHARCVFVASETLLEAKSRLNPNTHFSPHGVDVEHFARAEAGGLPIPADLEHLPRPIVGYFGLVERWIDLDLVAELARRRPSWSFVLIGRLGLPADEAPQLPNLHYLGKKPYADLPAYGAQFDAAIIPYRMSHHVKHINPLKLREYLAMGKPVVSVSIPEIDRFADTVWIARSPEEFLAGLDAAVASADDAAAIRKRMRAVADASWEARVKEILKVVLEDFNAREPARDGVQSERAEMHPEASAKNLT